jgi:hypothetical protein
MRVVGLHVLELLQSHHFIVDEDQLMVEFWLVTGFSQVEFGNSFGEHREGGL